MIIAASRVSPRRSMAAAVASNCVVEVDALLFVFIFGPTHSPTLWFLGSEPKFAEPSAPPKGAAQSATAKLVSDPNNQRELTAIFGRVFKAKKYPLDKYVGKLNI